MKKSMNKILMIVLSIVMLFSLAIGVGCDCNDNGEQGGGGGFTPIEKKATVTLDKTSEKLIVGDYLTVTAYTNKVLDEDVVFETENKNVATVTERGQIEAISAGTTNIVAKYGDVTAKCAITVEWDDSFPVLIDTDGLESSYILFKNSSYEFRPAIIYRGRTYYDGEFTFVSTNEDVATFEGNVLKASNTLGVANCYVEGSWRGFDVNATPLLRSDFTVKTKNEAYISLKGTSEDFIELYTLSEFEGQTYKNTGVVEPEFYAEGEKVSDVEFTTVIRDSSLASFDAGVVTAKKYGDTVIEISCEYEGELYVKTIAIEIERPVADYQMEIGKFSSDLGLFKDASNDFASKTIIEEIYGTNDVEVIEAFQGHNRLIIEDNKFLGVTGAKDDVYHTVITIGTNTEIYNVALEVYGLYITEMSDFDYFATQASYNNYYYLAKDIDATSFEFKANENNSGTGLTGIFEGNGHVISNLTTKSKGLFGIVNGGVVRNVAFTNAKLTGYYPCLIAHVEKSTTTLKNVYVEVDSVAVRGGILFQQTMSPSATHENVVVVYGISQDDVRSVMANEGNQANISTFAPNRAVLYKDTGFKNCFSISYAPIGCSSPNGNDFSWTSHMMAENQVTLGEVDADGKTPLIGVTDWDKELLAKTTPTDVLKTTASAVATPTLSTGTDVIKGIKAYTTFEELAQDKANNEAILATFDRNYWTIIDGIPYWNSLYVADLNIVLRDNNGDIYEDFTLTDNTTELTISLEDGSQSYTDLTIEVPDCFTLTGRTIKLKEMPTKPKYEEIVIKSVISNMNVEKVLSIFVTPVGTEVEETITYSQADKELDFELLNSILDLDGEDAITKDNIDFYYVGGDTTEYTGEIDIPVKVADDRSDVEETSLTLLVGSKLYILRSVKAYTKVIDEAEDLKYFTLTMSDPYNRVDGYFVVTRDIDATDLEFDNHQLMSNAVYPGNGSTADVGFVGVFDGQGHVISNITTKSNGIFGNVMSAIIRNVAFTNVHTTGYYPALFGHNSNRGKDTSGAFTNVETLVSNVYVEVDSVASASGILFNNQATPTSRFKNVVVEYLEFDDNENSTEMGWVQAGKKQSIFGSVNFQLFNETTNYKGIYSNCFAITKAPLDINGTCYHFAENQFEYTIDPTTGKVISATAKDPFVTQVLGYKGKDLIPGCVALGVKAYDTYADMVSDATANTEWLATFNSDVWTVVNGVPFWKALYAESVETIVKNGEDVITEYVLGDAETTLSINLKDMGSVISGSTLTTTSDAVIVSGNTIKLKEKPMASSSFEVTISANVNGISITRTLTIAIIPKGIEVTGVINYSLDDKELDFDAINEELGLEGDSALAQEDIISYTLGSETESRTGEMELPVILSDANISISNDKAVESQTVRFIIGEEIYVLRNVMAYTKVIDEADDFNYFVLNEEKSAAGIVGYFAVTKDIDMTGYEHATHTFVGGGTSYAGGSDIGFHGVFDGLGHTISNFDSISNGIFGNMTAPVIKNVAFTNVTLQGYYSTLFAHNSKRDGWNGKAYTKEALFENVYIEVDEINVNTGRVNVLTNNSFPTSSKIMNVVVEVAITDEVLAKINANTLKVGTIGGNKTADMSNSLMFDNVYSISKAPLYAEGTTPYFAENQVEITERNANGIYINAIGNVLDSKVTDVLTGKGLTLDKKYFAPKVKAYVDYATMAQDAEANEAKLANFSSAYWTVTNGVPVWNTANA